jgi:hypothetical protein
VRKWWEAGELHNLYASENIIRLTMLRRMRWAGHVDRMGEMRNTKFWPEDQKGRDQVGDISIHGGIIL